MYSLISIKTISNTIIQVPKCPRGSNQGLRRCFAPLQTYTRSQLNTLASYNYKYKFYIDLYIIH